MNWKEREKSIEGQRKDATKFLQQWVRVLKHSGAYLWDVRDSRAMKVIRAAGACGQMGLFGGEA